MLANGITFKPSAPYSQEENGIAERKGRTLMERVRCTIIGGGIPDELWPEIFFFGHNSKDLKVFENADEKEDSRVFSYNAIRASGYQPTIYPNAQFFLAHYQRLSWRLLPPQGLRYHLPLKMLLIPTRQQGLDLDDFTSLPNHTMLE